MKKRKYAVTAVTAAAVLMASAALSGCGAGGSAGGDDEVIRLKFGIVNSDSSNYYFGCQAIAEEVREATDGKIEITIYPSGQLGNERDLYEGAQLGSIDMFYAANAVMSSFIPEMSVLDQPFLFEDADEAHRVIDGKLGDLIAEKAEVQGIHIVGWMESGFRNVFANRPIQTVDDFEGLKIRTMENSMHMELFNSLGTMATPMASGDVFTGLQQKTIDAAENAVSDVLFNKYYEVTKNITYTQHLFVFMGVGLSDRAWDKIPDDLKPAFTEAVKRGCATQRQLLVEANEAAEKELKELGVQFYEIDREALKAMAEPAIEPYRADMPAEWLEAIEAGKADTTESSEAAESSEIAESTKEGAE